MITLPGDKSMTFENIEVHTEQNNNDKKMSVNFTEKNGQKHLLTVDADGVVQLDMKPLTTIGKDVPTQASSDESHPEEKSLSMKEDNNSDKEALASVQGMNGWDGKST